MDATAPRFPSRRLLIAAALTALPAQGLVQQCRVITILGDSITAGYGLPSNAALPVQLQAQMRKLGSSAIIRGAGVSGDTPLAELYAGVRTLRIADGPDEVHNRTIARLEYAKHGGAAVR